MSVIAIPIVASLAAFFVLSCICCAILYIMVVAVRWCRQKREESGDYDMVLAHGNTTTVPQPTTASTCSNTQTSDGENGSIKAMTLSQHQEQAEHNGSLLASCTARRQVQPYAVMDLPNGDEGMLQIVGMHRVGNVDKTGVHVVGGADGRGGNREYKELDLKTLEVVHPYTPLDVSTLMKEEGEGNVKQLADFFVRRSKQAM